MEPPVDKTELSEQLVKQIEFTSVKDCKSIDDFSYDKLELIRGETPDNIAEQCLVLCKNYLGGVWTQQTVDTINIKRLSGGLTNQMYCCALNDWSLTDGVPHEVAVRLYGLKHYTNEDGGNERLTDMIIALMMSENKLGSKIYGIFENGQIQNFIKVFI